jgi:hypothetical protein
VKLKYIIGVLALLLLTVSTASANPYELTLASTDSANDHVWVHVDYLNSILTFTDKSSTLLTSPQTLSSNSGIQAIAISNKIPASYVQYIEGTRNGVTYVIYTRDPDNHPLSSAIGTHDWEYNKGPQANVFGDFQTTYGDGANYAYSKVMVHYSTEPTFVANDEGHIFGVHYRLCIMNGDGTVSYNEATFFVTDGPETPDVSVPEFPTIAVPVAAILGLMFIFGRRKQE